VSLLWNHQIIFDGIHYSLPESTFILILRMDDGSSFLTDVLDYLSLHDYKKESTCLAIQILF